MNSRVHVNRTLRRKNSSPPRREEKPRACTSVSRTMPNESRSSWSAVSANIFPHFTPTSEVRCRSSLTRTSSSGVPSYPPPSSWPSLPVISFPDLIYTPEKNLVIWGNASSRVPAKIEDPCSLPVACEWISYPCAFFWSSEVRTPAVQAITRTGISEGAKLRYQYLWTLDNL